MINLNEDVEPLLSGGSNKYNEHEYYLCKITCGDVVSYRIQNIRGEEQDTFSNSKEARQSFNETVREYNELHRERKREISKMFGGDDWDEQDRKEARREQASERRARKGKTRHEALVAKYAAIMAQAQKQKPQPATPGGG